MFSQVFVFFINLDDVSVVAGIGAISDSSSYVTLDEMGHDTLFEQMSKSQLANEKSGPPKSRTKLR